MEHLDRLIPLVILGAVGAFLLFLLRRAQRERSAPRSEQIPIRFAVPVIAEPVVAKFEAPVVVVAKPIVAALVPTVPIAKPVPVAPVVVVREKRRKKHRPTAAAAPKTTPIESVLGLLKEKDALATAFLLREILGAPVSSRLRRGDRSAPCER